MITMKPFKIIVTFLFVAVQTSIYAQELSSSNRKAVKLYDEALIDFKRRNYSDFFRKIDGVVKIDPSFTEAFLLGMQGYIECKNDSMALYFGKSAFNINPTIYPPLSYLLGGISLRRGEYENAISYLKYYAEKYPAKKDRVKELLEHAYIAKDLKDNPIPFEPQNLGDSVNTAFDDYWPSISGDGNTLVKTSNTPTEIRGSLKYQEDFFISYRDSLGKWSKMKLMPGKINTLSNEGAQSLTADGKGMYLTICNLTCHIYYSKQTKDGWSIPEKLPIPVNSESSDKQPSISPDGKYLYFTSNRAGGIGGYDLYVAIRDDETGEWDEVVNLGSTINTIKNDVAPFIHFDGRTLYFASDGLPGLGGLDIYYTCKQNDGSWSKPVNLGYPINTSGEEQGIIISPNAETAYIASRRTGSKGLDIYTFPIPQNVKPLRTAYIRGVVTDAKTKLPLEAKIVLSNFKTKKNDFVALSQKDNGSFFTSLPANVSYALQVEKDGYLFHSECFKLDSVKTIQNPLFLNIELSPLEVGRSIVLKNVFYDFNSYNLTSDSYIELDKLVTLLEKNPTVWIQISGHTDNIGSDDYNKTLSEKRALAVKTYLIEKGVDKRRLKHVGYGSSKPVGDNATEEGRALNRRTEAIVLSK